MVNTAWPCVKLRLLGLWNFSFYLVLMFLLLDM